MSYLLRGTLLSSAMFFLIYGGASLVLVVVWRLMRERATGWSASRLFLVRMLPLLAAVIFVVAFFAPSFVYFEPRHADEHVGALGLALALSGIGVLGLACGAAVRAVMQAHDFVSRLPAGGELQLGDEQRAVGVHHAQPLILVSGPLRPRIFVSDGTAGLLTETELRVAMRHEVAHIESKDNLKKLLLRCVRFPMLAGLDRGWMHTAELEADDRAVTDEVSALELASALLKMAQHSERCRIPQLALSLAPEGERELQARMLRLLNWKPTASRPNDFSARRALAFAAMLLFAAYLPLAGQVHELAELLTR